MCLTSTWCEFTWGETSRLLKWWGDGVANAMPLGGMPQLLGAWDTA